MKKPSLFRVRDLLVGLLPALLMVVLSVMVQSGDSGAEASALMWTVTAVMSSFYGIILYNRKKFLDRINFVTKHGMYIILNGADYTREEIERTTDETLENWSKVTGWDGGEKSLKEMYIFFDKEVSFFNVKVEGYYAGEAIHVTQRPKLERTAFIHELGHRIYNLWKGNKNEKEHHDFMLKHNLD